MRREGRYKSNNTIRRFYLHDSRDEEDRNKIRMNKRGLSVDNHFIVDEVREKIGKVHFCALCNARFCCRSPSFDMLRWFKRKREEVFNIKYLDDYLVSDDDYDTYDDEDIIEE
jgi:hypothetical protein